jgi:hypothetical protein
MEKINRKVELESFFAEYAVPNRSAPNDLENSEVIPIDRFIEF